MREVKMLKGAETLASLAYTRDNSGQVTKIASKGLPGAENTEVGYDTNKRLAKVGSLAYEYDGASNPTKVGESIYKYNAASQLETGPGTTYGYDELGERTKTTPSVGPSTTYGYDQAGNLVNVKRSKEGEVPAIEDTYGYNGERLRTSQTISGATSYMTWDPSEELPLLLDDESNFYIYGPLGVPIEQITSEGKVRYLHHDQTNSTRLLTGSTGTVEATYTYDAYGDQTAHAGTATTPLDYDGQYTNSDTGLIYLRARVYDPATAQFLTVDPAVSLTGAPYNYAEDNPLNQADPSGRCGLVCVGGIVLGGVAVATGVGEVVAGGVIVGEGTLGVVSAVSGAAGAVADTTACTKGDAIGCVGAGVGTVASAGAGAVALGFVTGDVASATTAIGLTTGGISFLSDVAGAFASENSPEVSGCG
jgi:RHS repeat-associated protein